MPCGIEFDFWKAITCILAVTTAAVAFQQYVVSRNKLKLDLFEKRYAVFSAARKFLSGIFEKGAVGEEELEIYQRAFLESEFLFEPDMAEYLWEIHTRANKLLMTANRMKSLPTGPEKDKQMDIWSQENNWLRDQLKEIGRHFNPYMAFGKWKN